jgi:hypothetical protein
LVTLAALLMRQRALAHSRRLVLEDGCKYDEAWAKLRSSERADADLAAICEQISRLTAKATCGGQARQFNHQHGSSCSVKNKDVSCLERLRPPFLCEPRLFYGPAMVGTVDLAAPVDSLDQLYAQACILHPVLLDKTRAWAAASGGYFQNYAGQGMSRFYRIAKVKSVSRAIEKLVRSYAQARTEFFEFVSG